MSRKDSSLRPYLDVAVRACRAAGKIQVASFGSAPLVEHKGEIDLVTAIDRRSEKEILAIIGRAFPGHGILAEESDPRAGDGAFLNGTPLRVSGQAQLDQAFLATGFPYDIRRSRRNNIGHFSNFATRCLAVRRAGAAALDLAYVAAGRFDGFWELKLRPWDIAAASLLIEEAGGRVTGLAGRPWRLSVRDIVASNGLVHDEMLDVLHLKRPNT